MKVSNIIMFVLIVIAITGAIIWELYVVRIRRSRFRGRTGISLEKFIQKYYSEYDISPEIVDEVLTELSESYSIPKELFRASDSFNKELGPVDGFQEAVTEIEWYLESLMKKHGHKDADISGIETIDDLIRFVAEIKRSA